jgi:type VI secretion system protein ImpL
MRWVAIVLGAVVLLAVWIAGILIPDLRWVAELVTAIVVLTVLLVVLVRWLLARAKASAIERELMKQSAAADPEKRPEIVALRADMRQAVDALKRMRRGPGGGQAALYRLPWYVIVGPAAVGKTTALERSGLSFVTSASGAPKIRGTAGTRNCDWWISDEAILLDTAGRFATADDDRDEWNAFLDSLARLRPDRPLDGLMVAISIPDILAASDAERHQLAAKLRARLDEVLQRLEIVLPVYLLLTKADLVAGFVEFWSVLTKPQRGQVWGASFDLSDPRLADPGRVVEAEFDELVDGMHARMLQRIPNERSPQGRARVMQFPLEFRALRAPLGQFVDALCRPGPSSERPLLRGFYFTSGTQVGRPVDRVLAGMARGFDLRAPTPAGSDRTAEGGEAQSYFLTDVFRSVILPDRSLAVRSAAGMAGRSRREFVAALAALGVAAFVLIPAIVSYVHNTGLAHQVDQASLALESGGAASVPGMAGDPVEIMLDTLERMDDEATGFGIPGWFGPRAARDLRVPLRQAYIGRLHAALRGQLAADLEAELDRAAMASNLPDPINKPQDRTPRRAAYEALRLYATLVDPDGHVDPEWTAGRLALVWKAALAKTASGPLVDEARLAQHAANYLTAIADDANAGLRWPDDRLRGVRKNLRGDNREAAQLAYHWVLRKAFDVPGVAPADLLDAPSLKYVDCQSILVDGVYTKNGWRKISAALADPLPPSARIEPWVLDDTRVPADDDGLRQQIRKQYYDEYTSAWTDVPPRPLSSPSLLDRCGVSSQASNAGAGVVRDELDALKGPRGFYRRFFEKFEENVIFDEPKKAEILGVAVPMSTEGCASKIPGIGQKLEEAGVGQHEDSPVQQKFHPFLVFSGTAKDEKAGADVPLDKYLSELEKLTVVLGDAGSQPAPDQANQFATTKHAIDTLLDAFVEPTRSKVRKLLMAPVESTIVVKRRSDDTSLGQDWKTAVWTFWHDQLRDRWPFNQRSRDVADFEDFRKFFQPTTGILWDFVNKSLKDRVELSGNRYIPKADADSPVGTDVFPCLNVSKQISDTFFGTDNGLKLSVWVDWTASDVTEAKFLLDKKPIPLTRGQWTPVKWSGENEVTLECVQAGLHQDASGYHSFALFDLFKTLGGLNPTGNGAYSAQSPPLSVKVRALGDNDAFRADFFSKLSCPETVQAAP